MSGNIEKNLYHLPCFLRWNKWLTGLESLPCRCGCVLLLTDRRNLTLGIWATGNILYSDGHCICLEKQTLGHTVSGRSSWSPVRLFLCFVKAIY